MIKSTPSIKQIPNTKNYPYIGFYNHTDNKSLVLFTSPKTGTCIGNLIENCRYGSAIGKYSTTYHEEEFLIYQGKVTLENS